MANNKKCDPAGHTTVWAYEKIPFLTKISVALRFDLVVSSHCTHEVSQILKGITHIDSDKG